MMLPVLLCMDAVAVWMYRRECDWSLLRIMLPGAAIGTLAGWALWAVVSDAVVLLMVGVVTLVFVLDAVLPLRKKLEGLPPSKPWGTFWGGVAGFTSFISHTGGPPSRSMSCPAACRRPFTRSATIFFRVVNIPSSPVGPLGKVVDLARDPQRSPAGPFQEVQRLARHRHDPIDHPAHVERSHPAVETVRVIAHGRATARRRGWIGAAPSGLHRPVPAG